MKKVFLALGLFAFILAGVVSVDTAVASDMDNVVYDDPPKADKKSSKSCADYSKSSCCSSKSATMSKADCDDNKEGTSTAKVTTESTSKTATASTTTTTKKSSPDKK